MYLVDLGAVQADVRVFDETYQLSAPLTVPIGSRPIGPGQMCVSVPLAECAGELACTGGVCAVGSAAMSACGEARALPITGGVGTAMGSLPAGGVFESSCGAGSSREDLHRITVPGDRRYDVLATTDRPGTGASVDTVLYLRQQCELPTTELACDDDGASSGHSSIEALELMSGDYVLFVEASPPASSYQLEVRLRAVREPGEACDPAGVVDRCRIGVCGAGSVCG